jgi:RNA polymerase sigma factor (sigma-70 family)
MDASKHLGLAWHRAKWWYRNSPGGRILGFYELLSETYLGLVIACQRYDPARGATISTFATHWMDHFVQTALRKARLHGLWYVADAKKSEIHAEGLMDRPERVPALEQDAAEEVRTLVAKLPPKERRLILDRFWEGKTLREVGEVEGLTREGVRVRQRHAIKRLREYVAESQ